MRKRDKIHNLPRNRSLINAMSKLEIFRSSEIVGIGEGLGLSKRTVDSILKSLSGEELLIQVRRGVYITSELDINKKSLCRIARTVSKNDEAIVSFDSALGEGIDEQGISIMVSSGKIGVLKTAIGDMRFFNVSKRLVKKIDDGFGSAAVYSSDSEHTPEMALALCCYLATTAKSNFNINLEDVNMKGVDIEKSVSMMKSLGIPRERYEGFVPSSPTQESQSPSP